MSNSTRPTIDKINKPQFQDDELDLIEIIAQLWKGKKVIIASVIACVIIAVIYISVVKEQWTSSAIVSQPASGQVSTFNSALSVLYQQNSDDKIALPDLQRQVFARWSASAYALSGALRNLEEPKIFDVSPVVKTRDDPLNISFTATTAKEAQAQLTHYIDELNKETTKEFEEDIERSITEKLRSLQSNIDSLERIALLRKNHHLDVIKQSLKIAEASGIQKSSLVQAEYLSDDTQYLLGVDSLKAMIENERSKPLVYDVNWYDSMRAYAALKSLKIDFSNVSAFQYIQKADLPLRRDSPRKSLILILSAIFGLIIGSGIIIIRNISESYKMRKM